MYIGRKRSRRSGEEAFLLATVMIESLNLMIRFIRSQSCIAALYQRGYEWCAHSVYTRLPRRHGSLADDTSTFLPL